MIDSEYPTNELFSPSIYDFGKMINIPYVYIVAVT